MEEEGYFKELMAFCKGSQLSRQIGCRRNKRNKYLSLILLPLSLWQVPNREQRSPLRESMQTSLPGKVDKGGKKDDRYEQKLLSTPSILR